jgi:hypothetical protein
MITKDNREYEDPTAEEAIENVSESITFHNAGKHAALGSIDGMRYSLKLIRILEVLREMETRLDPVFIESLRDIILKN